MTLWGRINQLYCNNKYRKIITDRSSAEFIKVPKGAMPEDAVMTQIVLRDNELCVNTNIGKTFCLGEGYALRNVFSAIAKGDMSADETVKQFSGGYLMSDIGKLYQVKQQPDYSLVSTLADPYIL